MLTIGCSENVLQEGSSGIEHKEAKVPNCLQGVKVKCCISNIYIAIVCVFNQYNEDSAFYETEEYVTMSLSN